MVRVTADERNDACNRIHWKVLNRFSVVYLPIILFRMQNLIGIEKNNGFECSP